MASAIAFVVILALLAVFQLALVFGAPLGRFAWGGQHRVLPAKLRVGSFVSILVYAAIALLALDRVGAIDVVPDLVSTVGMWVVFGYFVLGILMNAISRSKPERYTMTPVVTVLAVLSLLIALS
ncbi:hypothetical protein ET445_00535 [Agromyces protaetiae]|uniref:Integral membrane protein n=1 Tax=Agromyces protaetiae TaxID=2509455 RepID=A0A4P6FCG7_9MICO|nr:hypothetical protein [Agromyces protaetiae]QAY72039.1 hypothetical protein ET445_00535 [Agromyces protaetiae]